MLSSRGFARWQSPDLQQVMMENKHAVTWFVWARVWRGETRVTWMAAVCYWPAGWGLTGWWIFIASALRHGSASLEIRMSAGRPRSVSHHPTLLYTHARTHTDTHTPRSFCRQTCFSSSCVDKNLLTAVDKIYISSVLNKSHRVCQIFYILVFKQSHKLYI